MIISIENTGYCTCSNCVRFVFWKPSFLIGDKDFDAEGPPEQLSVVNTNQSEESVTEALIEGVIYDLKCDEMLPEHIKQMLVSVHGNVFSKEPVEAMLLICYIMLLLLFSLMACLNAFYNYFSVKADKSTELGFNLIVSFVFK